jgi:hypothetical protein
LTGEGPELAGDLSIHALDVDAEAGGPVAGHALDWPSLQTDLPHTLSRRLRTAHKGTFGTLAIIGGADGMSGAARR